MTETDGKELSVGAWTLYGMVVLVRLATLVWAMLRLPDRVAMHFGPSGAPDGWGSRSGYIALDIAISALVVLGLPMLVNALLAGSGAGLNIPHKEFWLREENRPLLRRRLTGDMLFMAGATGLLLSWVDVEVVRANALSTPAMGPSAWIAAVLFGGAVIGYTVWMATTRYAVPRGARES